MALRPRRTVGGRSPSRAAPGAPDSSRPGERWRRGRRALRGRASAPRSGGLPPSPAEAALGRAAPTREAAKLYPRLSMWITASTRAGERPARRDSTTMTGATHVILAKRGTSMRNSFRQPFDPLGFSEVGHWLCVPGFRRVCLVEEQVNAWSGLHPGAQRGEMPGRVQFHTLSVRETRTLGFSRTQVVVHPGALRLPVRYQIRSGEESGTVRRNRSQRAASRPNALGLRALLQPHTDASRARQGCAGSTGGTGARKRRGHRVPRSRGTPSSIRTSSRLTTRRMVFSEGTVRWTVD